MAELKKCPFCGSDLETTITGFIWCHGCNFTSNSFYSEEKAAENVEPEGRKMKEYIERAAVKDAILSWAVCINHPELLSKEDIMHCIDSLPVADVAPVRHGRWIDAESDDGCTVWHCSKCSYPIKTICGYPIYKYCPMCGALMDGKEADHD